MTANVMETDQRACRDAGMDDFVGKPFDLQQLLSTLRKWTAGQPKACRSDLA